MLRSKGSDLKASHNQQLCENWVSKSVNYLDAINVGYSKMFDKNFKDVWSSSSTKLMVTSWEPGFWHFCSFFYYRGSFFLKQDRWRNLGFCRKLLTCSIRHGSVISYIRGILQFAGNKNLTESNCGILTKGKLRSRYNIYLQPRQVREASI